MIKMMNQSAILNFRKWTRDLRIFGLLFFLFCSIHHQTDGMAQEARAMGTAVNALSVFPIMYNNRVMIGRIIMQAGILVLFCDAPFLANNQKGLMIRTKRKAFCMGQMLYIIYASIVYTAFLTILSCLTCISNMGVSANWGSYIESAVAGRNNKIIGNLYVCTTLVKQYSAIQAFVLQIILFILGAIFLGLFIYYLNLRFGSQVGLVGAGLLVGIGDIPVFFPYMEWINWYL